jgi:hypothetical protein
MPAGDASRRPAAMRDTGQGLALRWHRASSGYDGPMVRTLTIAYLFVQGTAAAIWWLLLLLQPAWRRPFVAAGAPDSTLLAFLGPDALLYIGAALAAAYGLWRSWPWAGPVLLLHAGAAPYAALYGAALAALSPGTWLGALLMGPGLFITPLVAWRFRTGAEAAHD